MFYASLLLCVNNADLQYVCLFIYMVVVHSSGHDVHWLTYTQYLVMLIIDCIPDIIIYTCNTPLSTKKIVEIHAKYLDNVLYYKYPFLY